MATVRGACARLRSDALKIAMMLALSLVLVPPGLVLGQAAVDEPANQRTTAQRAVSHTVSLDDEEFSPQTITVAPGDSVTWEWADDDEHNVWSDAGQAETFQSENQEGGSFTHTFTRVGSFDYVCTEHEDDMTGRVVVRQPAGATDTTPPAAPTGLSASGGQRSVSLNWADNTESDVADYVVERRAVGAAWPVVASPSASSYVDSGLSDATTYVYRVRAYDTAGNPSAPSAEVTATTAAAAPGGGGNHTVAVTNNSFTPSTVSVAQGDTVNWQWASGSSTHNVRSNSGQAETFSSADQSSGSFTHTFTQQGRFSYVCTRHSGMNGTVVVGQPPVGTDTTPPAAPTGQSASGGQRSVSLDWADNPESDVAGYRVERRTAGGTFSEVASPGGSSYVDAGLSDATSYVYRVRAYDLSGNVSAPSGEVSATTADAPPSGERSVSIGGYEFAPSNITVNKGDTVVWRWTGPDTNHDVSSTPGQAETFQSHPGVPAGNVSGPPAGGTYSHKVDQLGTFSYLCRVHPEMTGTVKVVESGAPAQQESSPSQTAPPPAPGPEGTAAPGSVDHAVGIANLKFSPGDLTISQGDSVTWRWTGADKNHSVRSSPGEREAFDSHPGVRLGQINGPPAGGKYKRVFSTLGTVSYFCPVHPSMKGTINVRERGRPPAVDQAPPRISAARARVRGRRVLVRFRLSEPARVTAKLMRRGSGRQRVARRMKTYRLAGKRGANVRRLKLPRSARRGSYRLVLVALDAKGNRSAPRATAMRVRR